MIWKHRRTSFDLASGSVVMGILNTTPDSFSDGGCNVVVEAAVSHALAMVEQGAGIIDVGGESTRPGAGGVSAKEEISRTVPVIEALRERSDVVISIDTSKPAVARAAIEAGADVVNDVTGLRDAEMVSVCAQTGVGVCVMHMQGQPRTMQDKPDYADGGGVVAVVKDYLVGRVAGLIESGIKPEFIAVDPGIGFGKTLEHNLDLLGNLGGIQDAVQQPLLLGVSRKSCLGGITGVKDPAERDVATALVTGLARKQGICLHRVHDVGLAVQALRVAEAIG